MRRGERLVLVGSTLDRSSGESLFWMSGVCAEGWVRHLKPFECKVEYRSEKARVLVEQANLLHN